VEFSMASREYLQNIVNLVKGMITDRDKKQAMGKAGGARGPKGVEAEELLGVARISPRTVKNCTDEELFDLHESMHKLATSSKKDVYRNAHRFISDELTRRGHSHEQEEHEFSFVDIGDVHVNKLIPEVVEDYLQMPFPGEHACRIAEPGKFVRFRRNNSSSPNTIIGFKKDGSSALQTFRYPKESWAEDRARKHCAEHGGSFEAAREN
jgi:hypothetical protein